MPDRIFIVEDNQEIVDLLKKGLLAWDYAVSSASDFHNVVEEVTAFGPDLVLMDVNLPFYNGFYWTPELRKNSQLPIIFLSSRDADTDQIMAMNLGADDYITKPFNLDLLIVKIKALLRRTAESAPSAPTAKLVYKDFALNILENEIERGENVVPLSKNETKLLYPLFENAGEIVSRESIMEDLWDDELFVDRNTLSVMVNRIRTKTKDIDFGPHLQTVKGKGLKLDD